MDVMIANNNTWNRKIWRKMLNSVACKYDCGVRFNIRGDRLEFDGDRECAMEIIRETSAMIGVDEPLERV
jgi:hypothetical protein